MCSLSRYKFASLGKALAIGLGIVVVMDSSGKADDQPRCSAGFPGFGLSYHLGYGYGGDGLGVGALGGYPLYGGPGYPHCAPTLRRIKQISPFLYYGGPGYPRLGYSNYFDGIGPLVERPPIVQLMDGRGPASAGGYGAFTGTLPYPDTLFAPYSSVPEATGTSSEKSPSAVAPSNSSVLPSTAVGQPGFRR